MPNPESDASPILTVVVNDEAVIEFDRRKPLAAKQRHYLDQMDRNMDAGFEVNGQFRQAPDLGLRAQFVATGLVQAWQSGNEGLAAATCSYLALRLPDLKQVRAKSHDGQLHIDLVFDKEHVPVQKVQFTRPPGKHELH